MHLHDRWYAAAWSTELERSLLGRKLLGRKIVLYRDSAGFPHALGARCPHRGADLSKGRIVDGLIECPFHGWRWNTDGSCARVPSQSATAKIPSKARTEVLEVEEREGIVWIREGGQSCTPPELGLPEFGTQVTLPPRLFEGALPELLENALDTAHNAFIHRRVFGSGIDPIVSRQIVETDREELTVSAAEDPESPWKPKGPLVSGAFGFAARLLGQSTPVTRTAHLRLGCSTTTCVEYASQKWDAFILHLTPADSTRTWMFYETRRTRAPLLLFNPLQRSFMRRVLDDGERELDLVLRDGSGGGPPVSVESDRLGLAARRFYLQCLERARSPRDADGGLSVAVEGSQANDGKRECWNES